MTATIESVAHLIHSLRNLPQHERAASHIVKAAFELTNPDETAFILTVLGVSLASDPGAVACKVHLYIHYAHRQNAQIDVHLPDPKFQGSRCPRR